MSLWETIVQHLAPLFSWPKDAWLRKAKNLSYHIHLLLNQTENISQIAEAMYHVVSNDPGTPKQRSDASVLWGPAPTQLFLKNWLANAWVLDQRKKSRPLRCRFMELVEQLRRAAIDWHEADLKWRGTVGITENEWRFRAEHDFGSTPEAVAKKQVAQSYRKVYEEFLSVHQDINNALRPLLRD